MGRTNFGQTMRIYHRYLGFFLVGVMGIYALSGTVMIFRTTDFLKVEKEVERELPPDVKSDELGGMLRMRDFKVLEETDNAIVFNTGTYNKETGMARFTSKELPFVLNKLTQMHKATIDRPLFFMNVFFGVSLLFFVISSLWMFSPQKSSYKKGIYFLIGGLIVAIIIVFV